MGTGLLFKSGSKKLHTVIIRYNLIHSIFTKNLSWVNTWLKNCMRKLPNSRMQT